MRRNLFLWCTVAPLLLLLTGVAMAQNADLTQSNTAMNGLLREVHDASNSWGGRLQGYALKLLFGLAAIQLVWTFMPVVLRQADLGEIVHELVKYILVIGFFYALIEHSTDWASAVVNSFREAGAHASGFPRELMPGDVFSLAVEFSEKIVNAGVSILSPVTSVLVGISAIIVLLCFAFIAALIFVTLVEAYVIINASVLLLGFGGSQWTRDFAVAPLRYAVAVGVKLFVLTLLVGLILQAANGWAAKYTNDQASVLTLVGLSLVCAYLTRTIPELMGGMISGTSMGGGGAIGSMAALALTGGAMAAGAATSGAAAGAAGEAAGAAGGAASGPTSGGLAGAINASFANQPGSSAAGSTASAGSSVGGSGASAATSSRVGGAGAQSSATAPGVPPSAPAPKASGSDAGNDQAAKARAQTERNDAPPAGGGRSARQEVSAGDVAHAALRGIGMFSALSVPGMEGAASIGTAGQPPQMPDTGDDSDSPRDQPENVIRPATAAGEAPSSFAKPAPDASTDPTPKTAHLTELHVPGMDPSRSPDLGGVA